MKMNKKQNENHIAHTHPNDDGTVKVQTLEEHLANVATLTGLFASSFDSQEWGELIGQWHDVGKLNPSFQQYIRQVAGLIPMTRNVSTRERAHAAIGAIAINQILPGLGLPIAYCIAGHHSGLPNWSSGFGLEEKLTDIKKWETVKETCSFLPIPSQDPTFPVKDPKQFHQWIRMLFSCLVDADRLDTELFAQPEQATQRGMYDSLDLLKERLDNYLKRFDTAPSTPLNKERQIILQQCREKSTLPPGFFNLTVPTGGGKTISSIVWAVNHAIKYGKKRIIIAIPYTSIITQTAQTYRDIFGGNNVLEHHSNLGENISEDINANRGLKLATENWDVPIVVTTNVQLFESLHSNKPSICRKIHNVSDAVLILDEAQMLPVKFLEPVLHCLEGLVSLFNTSVLFTTATQPAFSGIIGLRKGQFEGISSKIHELIPNSDKLFEKFKRTELHCFPLNESFTAERVAVELCKYEQVLCVVNTRKQAQAICKEMPDDTIHLSRNMYSQHLMREIERIRLLLQEGNPVRVVSTQLIEAGIDIDFPVVFRAFAGLDSIVQAAGRCNREGKLEIGHVHVFKFEGERARGLIAKGQAALSDLLYSYSLTQLATPALMKMYFDFYYSRNPEMDKPNTEGLLYTDAKECKFQFEEYSRKFRLIDDEGTETFLLPMEDGAVIYEKLLRNEILTLKDYRTMQRFSVCVSSFVAKEIHEQGGIEEINEIKILNKAFYNCHYGVVVGGVWSEEFLNV